MPYMLRKKVKMDNVIGTTRDLEQLCGVPSDRCEAIAKTLATIGYVKAPKNELVPKVDGNTSDGYHTFNELYDHRCLLWINYCLLNMDKCYLVPNHFDGWFLLGMKTAWGQISYHCPNKFYGMVGNFKIEHPEFDGHTPQDVINRLESLAVNNRFGSSGNDSTKEFSTAEVSELTLFKILRNYEMSIGGPNPDSHLKNQAKALKAELDGHK